MSKGAKGMILEMNAEKALADQLFGGEDNTEKVIKLNTEKEYKQFGKSTADILYQGKAPYRIDAFYKELSRDLGKHCEAKKIKEVVDFLTTIYNETNKSEKKAAKTTKEKPKLASGKVYERNNNAAMINDVMGKDDNDAYGDYGDYGNEGQGFTREQEAGYDFM